MHVRCRSRCAATDLARKSPQLLPPGSTLMLFTDGLVERKRESIDDGIARAADVLVDTMRLPPDSVADAMLGELAPAAGYDDDVAMVIYRHELVPLRIESEANADNLAGVRRRLAGWLRAADVPDELAADIVLVISEACTNSVEHAYRGHSVGTMLVEVEAVDGEVHARVGDSGSWKTPAAATPQRRAGPAADQGHQRLGRTALHGGRNNARNQLSTAAAAEAVNS